MNFITSLFDLVKTPSLKILKKGNIPIHVAIIMDGNGRWAAKKNLPRILGHNKGAEVLKEIVIASKDLGIKYLTAYSFSSENWQRPQSEVGELIQLIAEVLEKELAGLIENDIKLKLIGQREIIPKHVLEIFENAEKKTLSNGSLVLNIAFSYGSRQEIFQAARKLCGDLQEKKLDPGSLDLNVFSNYLYTAGIPDPDLLIRTSGEYRISNLLLWQIAYTELYFTRVLWPDFNKKSFFRAIYDYQQRCRRFGRL